MVATSPAYSHRLPHVFSRPDEFDPERFAAPREEDKAAPFSFIGFGGGRHGCMGSNFAILQVQAVPSLLPHVTGAMEEPRGKGAPLSRLALAPQMRCKQGCVSTYCRLVKRVSILTSDRQQSNT